MTTTCDRRSLISKALFAVIGLTRERRAVVRWPHPDAIPVSEPGWAGPIIYGQSDGNAEVNWSHGAASVRWRIVRRTRTEAVVLVDESFTRGWSRQERVFLRKRAKTWSVVRVLPVY